MNRFRLANCLGYANLVLDTVDHSRSCFFDDPDTIAGDARRDYTLADRQSVVHMMNQRAAGAGCPSGWTETLVTS